MKKLIGVLVVAALAAGGYYVWLQAQKSESTDDAEIDGTVVTISPRVTGHILEVLVADDQVVNKGDVLVKLDPRDYEVAVAKARANLATALATVQSSRTDVPLVSSTTSSELTGAKAVRQDAATAVTWSEQQVNVAKARLTVAQANVKVAEANALKAAQDVDKYKALVAKDEISRQQYDQAVATWDAAKATVEVQKAAVVEAENNVTAAAMAVDRAKSQLSHAEAEVATASTGPQQIAVKEARVNEDQARVAQYRAELEAAELNLSYTTIVAPTGGIIGKKNVNAGQNVAAGQQMMAIVSLDDLWVAANFKETQLKNMKVGQRVSMTLDAYGREYTGKISSVAGASGAKFSLLPPENATGNFVKVVQRIPVRIDFDPKQNDDRLLRPGMSVVPTVKVLP